MKHLRLNKIPVTSLIHVLTQLYEEGADFIAIEGEPREDSDNDVIKVTVRPEYYDGQSETKETDPEYLLTEVKPPEEDINPISDEDINDLI